MSDLFTPFQTLGLRNRVVMAPMTRCSCTPEGLPTPELADYYVRRAENGVGLVIIESAAINPQDAMGYINGCQFHREGHANAWRPIVDRIHQSGAKVWLQLFHAGRLTVSAISNCHPLAPSAIPPFRGESFWRPKVGDQIVHFQTRSPFETPAKMTPDQIRRIIGEFSASALWAEKAGFDGVELHGAHGYLLHGFCHTASNQRDDEHGPQAGFRFSTDLVKACKSSLSKMTLSYRLSLHMVDMTYIRYSEDEMNYPLFIRVLDEAGVDVFHCSELEAGSPMLGATHSLISLANSVTDKPVIACGRISTGEKANALLQNGTDLVAFGRTFISNPDLINCLKSPLNNPLKAFSYEQHFSKIH